VSGYLGDAGRALCLQQQKRKVDPYFLQKLCYPTARLALGKALRGIATAAIDISDGLWADCQHMVKKSGCGFRMHRQI
jgi:thiamine-monophosphate kinase